MSQKLADYDAFEVDPEAELPDPDDHWYGSTMGHIAKATILLHQPPKPPKGSWRKDKPRSPALVLTPAQAAHLALLEYAAAWRRIRRAKGGAA